MRMRFCSLSLLWLLCVAAGGQTSSVISGRVVDARSGQPLARCVVAINPTTQRTASTSVTTGDDGGFAFAGLGAGKYQLTASRRGYLTQAYQQHGDLSTAIAVGPGLPSEGLRFLLMPQSIVYGMISDEAGEPVRQAQVKLYAGQQRAGVQATVVREAASTDDLGKYEIAEVPPGDYYLSVSAQPWYAHGRGQIVSDFPPAAGREESPDSALDVAYPTTFYPNATDSDGATPIPLRGGERLEIDLTLTPQHALRLRMHVPQLDGVSFNLELTQSVFGQPEPVLNGGSAEHGGVIELAGVLPGRYDVTMHQFGGGGSQGAKHFTAEVGADATELIEEETVEDVTVTGKVTGLDGKAPHPRISLVCPRPNRNYYAPLDKAGGFSMNVMPGDYEVVGRIPQMFLARVASSNAPVHGRMVTVKGGASPVLEIAAAQGAGRIDGFVTAGSRRPGGVLVLLAPEDAGNNEILFRRDQSDSDGSFSLYNVIPGRYRLLAIDQGWDLEWRDPNVLAAFTKKSIPIQVHSGDKIMQLVEVQDK